MAASRPGAVASGGFALEPGNDKIGRRHRYPASGSPAHAIPEIRQLSWTHPRIIGDGPCSRSTTPVLSIADPDSPAIKDLGLWFIRRVARGPARAASPPQSCRSWLTDLVRHNGGKGLPDGRARRQAATRSNSRAQSGHQRVSPARVGAHGQARRRRQRLRGVLLSDGRKVGLGRRDAVGISRHSTATAAKAGKRRDPGGALPCRARLPPRRQRTAVRLRLKRRDRRSPAQPLAFRCARGSTTVRAGPVSPKRVASERSSSHIQARLGAAAPRAARRFPWPNARVC